MPYIARDPDTNEILPVKVDAEGCLSHQNQLARYAPMGFDDTTTANYVYVFYEDKLGNWVIKKCPTTTGTASYATGTSGSAAAFADPASQSYDTFSAKF